MEGGSIRFISIIKPQVQLPDHLSFDVVLLLCKISWFRDIFMEIAFIA